MDLYNVDTRQKENINDPNALHEALMSGTHSFQADREVNILKDGELYGTVPSENVRQAIEQGFEIETDLQGFSREYAEENKGIGGFLKVAAGQFADEAALGLPEIIFNKTGSPYAVAAKEALKKEWQLTNDIFGVAGGAASLFTGAPLWKLASKTGENVTKYVAGKIAAESAENIGKQAASEAATSIVAKMVGAGAEGAVVMSPHSLTEAAFGDVQEAGEALAAGILLGGAFSGVIHVGSKYGKKALEFAKKVENEKGATEGRLANISRTIIRHITGLTTGVPEKNIEYYVKNIDDFFDPRTGDSLVDDIVSIKNRADNDVSIVANKLDSAKINYENVNKNYVNTAKNIKQQMQDEVPEFALSDNILGSLIAEKNLQTKQSIDATQHLVDAGLIMPKETFLTYIANFMKSKGKVPISETAAAPYGYFRGLYKRTKDASLGTKENSRDYFVAEEIRDIIQGMYRDASYGPNKLAYSTETDSMIKQFVHYFSNAVKVKVPKYANVMEQMHARQNRLDDLVATFNLRGLNQRDPVARENVFKTLKAVVNNPTSKVPVKESLIEFEKVIGGDFIKTLNEITGNKKLIRETKDIEKLYERLNPGGAAMERQAREAFDAAKNDFNSIKRLSEAGSERAIRQMTLKNIDDQRYIETRKSFEALQKFSDEMNPERYDYIDQAIKRNVIDSFGKTSIAGSRKVVTGEALGKVVLGGTFGGFPGAALGYAADIYGGRSLKWVLDTLNQKAGKNIAGLLFVEQELKKQGQRLNAIPRILNEMSKPRKGLKPRTIALGAIGRMINDDDLKPQEKLEKYRDNISDLITNPTELENVIGMYATPLRESGAEGIADGLSMGAIRALKYLNDNIPKGEAPSSFISSKRAYQPSNYEMSTFDQRLAIVDDPLLVLEELEQGTLTHNHVDTLKQVYPFLYEEIKSRMIDYIASPEFEPMPYQERLKMSLMFDVPLDDSLVNILSLQSRFSQEEAEAKNLKGKIDISGAAQSKLQSATEK